MTPHVASDLKGSQEAVATLMMTHTKEQRQIRELTAMLKSRQTLLAVLAVLSLFLGVMINELCVAGDYIDRPLTAEEEKYMDSLSKNPRKCNKPIADFLKLVQSLMTAVIMGLVIVQYKLTTQKESSKESLLMKDRKQLAEGGKGTPKAFNLSIGSRLGLYLELVINDVHTVPFLNYDCPLEMSGTTVYYRLESILCALMLLRLYHAWRWVHMKVQFRYFNLEVLCCSCRSSSPCLSSSTT